MAKKVFIAAGHGGNDPGATYNGIKEKDLNLTIALECMKTLVNHGVTVKMNRTTDVNISWEGDVNTCNEFNPDLAVDIHNNAGGGDGVEVWHHYGGGTGKILANNIIVEAINIGQNSRGTKTKQLDNGEDYYYFIREISVPSVIVECAFIDNLKDVEIVDTMPEQKAMGVAIAKGILKTLGIVYNAQTQKQENKDTDDKWYRVQVGAFKEKSNADALVNKLKSEGYDAFVV